MVDLKCKKRSLEFLSFLAQDSHIITPTPPEILNLLQKMLRKNLTLLEPPAAAARQSIPSALTPRFTTLLEMKAH